MDTERIQSQTLKLREPSLLKGDQTHLNKTPITRQEGGNVKERKKRRERNKVSVKEEKTNKQKRKS